MTFSTFCPSVPSPPYLTARDFAPAPVTENPLLAVSFCFAAFFIAALKAFLFAGSFVSPPGTIPSLIDIASSAVTSGRERALLLLFPIDHSPRDGFGTIPFGFFIRDKPRLSQSHRPQPLKHGPTTLKAIKKPGYAPGLSSLAFFRFFGGGSAIRSSIAPTDRDSASAISNLSMPSRPIRRII